MKKILLVLVVLAFVSSLAVAIGAHLLHRSLFAPGHPDPDQEAIIEVPRGMTGKGLGLLLEQQGYIEAAWHWRAYALIEGGPRLKAGRFKIQRGMSIPQLVEVFSQNPLPEGEPFTFVEGWRLREADAALAERGWLGAGAYLEATRNPADYATAFPLPGPTLEGYLYPQTYSFVPAGLKPASVVRRQLDLFTKTFYEPYRPEIAASGHSLHELVTMASILEREEPNPLKRPLVAGILWKRLAIKMPLGVDATSRYELPEWNDRQAFLVKLRDPKCPWNTRLKRGLPPGPIGAPSLASLIAALRPVESDFWYYLHDATGELHPSRNLKEHEEARARYRVY